ncbi:MAG: BrnT family toxin [Chloroflexota bacterium]
MKVTGFIWFEDIVEKLESKHNVRQQDVREIFGSKPHVRFVEKGHRSGENVYAALGLTDGGRYLIVFLVLKKDGRALILSARDMTRNERRDYGQK